MSPLLMAFLADIHACLAWSGGLFGVLDRKFDSVHCNAALIGHLELNHSIAEGIDLTSVSMVSII